MDDTSTILIVDDNPTNLNVLFEYLEESGFEVSVAPNGEAALNQLKHNQPDLILLDIMMPGIDGLETCRRLKKDKTTRDIPVIFMTALTDTVDKIKGFLAGGEDYITKPLQYEEVLARITAHLNVRKLTQHVEAQNVLLQEKEALLSQKDQQLDELQTCKQTFFSYISSELQTPFHTLLGFTRVLLENLDRYGKDQIKSDVERLQQSAEQLYTKHENLLIWSKRQRNVLEFTPIPLNITEIVVYNIVLFTPPAQQKQIDLSSDIQDTILAEGDYNMVNIILHNVLSNALKFTNTGGKIKISAVEREDEVQVFIADNGSGMDQESIHRLFKQHAPCPVVEGDYDHIGLGLYLCKELVSRNGGKILAESEFGKGTTCIFTLPKMKQEDDV